MEHQNELALKDQETERAIHNLREEFQRSNDVDPYSSNPCYLLVSSNIYCLFSSSYPQLFNRFLVFLVYLGLIYFLSGRSSHSESETDAELHRKYSELQFQFKREQGYFKQVYRNEHVPKSQSLKLYFLFLSKYKLAFSKVRFNQS